MRWSTFGLVGATGIFAAASADAAETVHLYLKANGADIKGESVQTSLGRKDSIECVQIDLAMRTAGAARAYDAIRCKKRLDKSSPLIFKAWATGQTVDAVFKFFRPNPVGDGTTEQFYTVEIKGGRVDSVRVFVPNTIVPASSTEPPQEEVAFTFKTITFTFTNGGVTHTDTWAQQK